MQLKKLNQQKNEHVQERRRYARVTKNIAIKLKDKDVDFVTETKNISCIGAYCQVDSYLPILTKLKIALLLPRPKGSKTAKHIICEGTVVRVERSVDPVELNKYNIAIYFNQIAKNDMKLIDSYVKNHSNTTESASS
ncbi:MAG TPA: PilZ domain-containing protein [Candidatus Omnitrophota bacterium]|nr:PilZ domain-containing protein [Candidatus Omnitrophota bacterium]